MTKKKLITFEEVREAFNYDPETGIFKWRNPRNWFEIKPDGVSDGYINDSGYHIIRFKKRNHRVHRLIWLFMTGNHPKDQIDHINRIRTDNRWCNLREVTNQQNSFNTNTKGYTVVKKRKTKKYRAKIRLNNKSINMGSYDTAEEAHDAYLEAKKKYHGLEFYPINQNTDK